MFCLQLKHFKVDFQGLSTYKKLLEYDHKNEFQNLFEANPTLRNAPIFEPAWSVMPANYCQPYKSMSGLFSLFCKNSVSGLFV